MPPAQRRHTHLPAGLSLGQRKALALARRDGHFTLAQGAGALNWSQDSASAMLNGLVQSGALSYERSTGRFVLTAAGRGLLAQDRAH